MKYSVKVFMLLAIHFMRFFYKTHPIQFSLFPNHLLPKLIGCVPAMNKIESQSPMLLCSKFGWIWPSGLDAFENVKSKQTNGQTDDAGESTRKARMEFCSSELKRTQSILLNVTGDIMRWPQMTNLQGQWYVK